MQENGFGLYLFLGAIVEEKFEERISCDLLLSLPIIRSDPRMCHELIRGGSEYWILNQTDP